MDSATVAAVEFIGGPLGGRTCDLTGITVGGDWSRIVVPTYGDESATYVRRPDGKYEFQVAEGPSCPSGKWPGRHYGPSG